MNEPTASYIAGFMLIVVGLSLFGQPRLYQPFYGRYFEFGGYHNWVAIAAVAYGALLIYGAWRKETRDKQD